MLAHYKDVSPSYIETKILKEEADNYLLEDQLSKPDPYYDNEEEILESLQYSEKSLSFHSFAKTINENGTITLSFPDAAMCARLRPKQTLESIFGAGQGDPREPGDSPRT
jgi:hypothetical protein